jgi:hypothetical protein
MSDSRPVNDFVAYVLMAVGGLITLLCGGCTAFYLWTAIGLALDRTSSGQGSALGAATVGIFALIVGVLPTLCGAALFVSGVAMWRRGDNPRRRDVAAPVSSDE